MARFHTINCSTPIAYQPHRSTALGTEFFENFLFGLASCALHRLSLLLAFNNGEHFVQHFMRSYDVSEGTVSVDGVDVRDYTQQALHKKIGYVPQKANLFSGTISSNVTYGGSSAERSEEDLKKAIAIAQGTDFVEKMEGGYNAMISQGGTNLSGGQKQRLSIARAVYRRPEIYIFDDSFSALDYKTDRALRSALKKETVDVTSIIVAQRVGTIMEADKIVVLDNGNVVGIGKHRDLLDTCPVYKEIVYSQLSEEDLSK